MILIVALCGASDKTHAMDSGTQGPNPDLAVFTALPNKVRPLFAWPSNDTISGGKRVLKCTNRHLLAAKGASLRWPQKVIRKQWLPTDANYLSNQLIMIRDEYGPIDATHIFWEKNGYRIEVAQTKTVFAAKLTPLTSTDKVHTVTARKDLAKRLCSQLLNEYADVRVVRPVNSELIRQNVMPRLLSASFERARIRSFSDGVHGQCKGPDFKDKEDYAQFNFWWRRVNWWTDGKTVGLYTLKTEGGQWAANYGSKLDHYWFEGSPWQSKKSPDTTPE
jgi:hypothetical protein